MIAYFSDRQGEATERLAKLAGMTGRRVMNEPTAAAAMLCTCSKGCCSARWLQSRVERCCYALHRELTVVGMAGVYQPPSDEMVP